MAFFASLIFFVFILLVVLQKIKTKHDIGTFRAKPFLLSNAELNFYKALIQYLPKDKSIMVKVGLKEIIETTSNEKKQRSSDWARIKSKHIDFILIDSSTSKILKCIELDDCSHNSEAARKGDYIKNESLKSSGVQLVRVKASAGYSKEQLLSICE